MEYKATPAEHFLARLSRARDLHTTTLRWFNDIAVVLVIAAIFYAPTLQFGFLHHDDPAYIFMNYLVREPSLTTIFDPRTRTVSDWTPVVTLVHAVEYRLFGFEAVGFRAVQLFLHLISVFLLYRFLLKVQVTPLVALATVFIFALHPLQIESVAWLSSRKNILALIFGLLFLSTQLEGKWIFASFWLLLALGSKGTTVIFPLLGLLLVLSGAVPRADSQRTPLHERAMWHGLFIALALARAFLSNLAQAGVVERLGAAGMTFPERASISARVLVSQLKQFFFPNDLSVFYTWLPRSWSDTSVWGSWALILSLSAIAAVIAKKDATVRVGIIILGLALLPTMNLVPAPYFQADRYSHIPLIGMGLITFQCGYRCVGRAQLLFGLVILWYLMVLLPLGSARLGVWRTGETLWQDELTRYPNDPHLHYKLAQHYMHARQFSDEERELREVLRILPSLRSARLMLGLRLYFTKHLEEAETLTAGLVKERPDDLEARNLLSAILAARAPVPPQPGSPAEKATEISVEPPQE